MPIIVIYDKDGKKIRQWVDVYCEKCERDLISESSNIGEESRITVEPCPTCSGEKRKEGYEDGYKEGHDNGYEEGYKKGYDDGYNWGEKKGCKEGYKEGFGEGYDKGKGG